MHRTVRATSELQASRELAAFVTEVHESPPVPVTWPTATSLSMSAIEQFLTEHLLGEKGRDPRTVQNYRGVHAKWFSPEIGGRRVRDVDEAAIDRIFGRMRARRL